MQKFRLFVTGHKGFETPLFHELRDILAGFDAHLEKAYGGVGIDAELAVVYQICLHSYLANRVFCELARSRVENEAELYDLVYRIDWERHLQARNSIAVAANLSNSNLNHAHYVALKAKDAIVDRFRQHCASRPVVEKKQPDLQVNINIHRNLAKVSLDLSGESLHRRGYRLQHAGAPLKEHLAAAMLIQAGWGREQAKSSRLVDPMCGSGTFAIEAAMMAAGVAPGMRREYFGFNRWLLHEPKIWRECLQAAQQAIDRHACIRIFASDYDAEALAIARANAAVAGVDQFIEFSHQQLADLALPDSRRDTLIICNPPYGKRMQSEDGLAELYGDLGGALRRLAPARLAIISANPQLLHRLKLKRVSRKNVNNGPLDCLFAIFATPEDGQCQITAVTDSANGNTAKADEIGLPLRNRLTKNARHLRRWAQKSGVSCYRLYDADLPEFAFALDRYQSEISADVVWFHLQEYRAPATITAAKAEARIQVAVEVVKALFAIPEQQLFCKIRQRQRGYRQYQKHDNRNEFFQVREGAASLLINLSDYLDSGLFLDHRITRDRVYREARGKSVLNLFCYTAAVGVLAGLGGASSVLNVDLSATYLNWARENHLLNGLDDDSRFRFLRADILELLKHPSQFPSTDHYDLIFLDPPSFSNSTKMQQTLDIQRDHHELIKLAMMRLQLHGLLLFSTNRKGFKLDTEVQQNFSVKDISQATIDEDFRRKQTIHRCWEIRHAQG